MISTISQLVSLDAGGGVPLHEVLPLATPTFSYATLATLSEVLIPVSGVLLQGVRASTLKNPLHCSCYPCSMRCFSVAS